MNGESLDGVFTALLIVVLKNLLTSLVPQIEYAHC